MSITANITIFFYFQELSLFYRSFLSRYKFTIRRNNKKMSNTILIPMSTSCGGCVYATTAIFYIAINQ